MGNAKSDYEGFLSWLNTLPTPPTADARRLALLVHRHFDDIAETSTGQSQRSVLLARLARAELASIEIGPALHPAQPAHAHAGWTRLALLKCGPFRGFRHEEPFDLDSRVVLVLGENGSGKSSLCEAIEYALLGSIDEATQRRLDVTRYITNVHEGRGAAPELTAVGPNNEQIPIRPDPDAYQFCFIHGNRISAFSRIGSGTAQVRSERIAELFGIADFAEFVSGFNESMGPQLDLVPIQAKLLQTRRTAFTEASATVAGAAAARADFSREEETLAEAYQPGLRPGVLRELIGTPERPGRLQELLRLLAEPIPVESGISLAALHAARAEEASAFREAQAARTALAQRSTDVSFQSLYTAVLSLRSLSPARCPACETRLTGPAHTIRDPFQKATEGLEQLRALAQLQAVARERDRLAEVSTGRLRQQLRRLVDSGDLQPGDQLAGLIDRMEADPLGSWREDLDRPDPAVPDTRWGAIERRAAAAELGDRDIRTRQARRREQQSEFGRLSTIAQQVAALDARRAAVEERIQAATAQLDGFERDNAELIADVATESERVRSDSRINAAYDSFLALVRRYRRELPGLLSSDMSDLTRDLYNTINTRDWAEDKLHSVRLPVTADSRIDIAFNRDPERLVDALQVLSEGHLRCLGLAILLAKNIRLGLPVIVFDDAVTAIDDDHRTGIRETLFGNEALGQKQVILSCHGPEFIKDIVHVVPATDRKLFKLSASRTGHPEVSRNAPTRHYLEQAEASLTDLNPRVALASCRQALERSIASVWEWLIDEGLGEIPVKLRGPRAKPELHNLCTTIRSRLANATHFTPPQKATIVSQLDVLLGIPQASLEWTYLNGGTHEVQDREEFNLDIVERIIRSLRALDDAV